MRRGSITVDFIFGITIVAGISFILMGLCLTMAVVEISQYIAFSSSRSYFGAHKEEAQQVSRGRSKFEKLINKKALALLRGDWFTLSYVESGDFRREFPEKIQHDSDTFFGTQLRLRAKVLEAQIPLLGSTEGSGYQSTVASYLGREPNFEECANFERERWNRFVSRFPLQNASTQGASNVFTPIMDNGC